MSTFPAILHQQYTGVSYLRVASRKILAELNILDPDHASTLVYTYTVYPLKLLQWRIQRTPPRSRLFTNVRYTYIHVKLWLHWMQEETLEERGHVAVIEYIMHDYVGTAGVISLSRIFQRSRKTIKYGGGGYAQF